MELDNDQALTLLARVAQKDQRAFASLHKAVAPRVFAFAMSQLRDAQRAEEIVVDALHEVWRFPQRFNATSKFSTWVLGIARYKILNAFRSERDPTEEITAAMEETLVSEQAQGFDEIAQGQRQAGVRQCLDKLSGDHRESMHLVFFEGMALAEVAALTQCPENTVKTRLFHARQKIKNCLKNLLLSEGAALTEAKLAGQNHA
jgi:RNA polymerase sigma-70 factor, ECF subfamily